MCKRHTELNILVCCLSHVKKRTLYNGLEDHGRVSVGQQLYLLSVILLDNEAVEVKVDASHCLLQYLFLIQKTLTYHCHDAKSVEKCDYNCSSCILKHLWKTLK